MTVNGQAWRDAREVEGLWEIPSMSACRNLGSVLLQASLSLICLPDGALENILPVSLPWPKSKRLLRRFHRGKNRS